MELKKTGPVGALIKTFAILSANHSLFVIALLWNIAAYSEDIYSGFSGKYNPALDFLWIFLLAPLYIFVKGGFFNITIGAQDAKEKNWLSTFKEGGINKFVPLLLGSIFYFAIGMVFTIGVSISTASIAATIFLAWLLHDAAAVVVALIFLPLLSALLVSFFMFIQFYDIGIVAKGYGVIDSFKRSYRFTLSRFNSVFGFTLINYGLMFILFLPIMVYEFKTASVSLDQTLPTPLTEVPVLIIIGTLSTAFSFAYHSTFYVQNFTEVEEYESRGRLLLKLYGVGFVSLIIMAGLAALMYVMVAPPLEEFTLLQAELAQT